MHAAITEITRLLPFPAASLALDCMHAAITEITRLLPVPAASLAQRLRAVGGAVSQAAVLILPQIKLNSQLLHCAFFLS